MLNVTSGDAATIVVPFIAGGEYVSPDVNSVFYDVRDNEGFKVVTNAAITTTQGATEVAITIDSSLNTKVLDFEYRSLIVRYSVGGKPSQSVIKYRVVDWVNTGITADYVRSKLGVTDRELGDEDIDIFSAFYYLKNLVGSQFTSALSSGDSATVNANNAVLYRTILDVLPALRLKLRSVEAEGTVRAERLKSLDLDKLHDLYSELLSTAIGNVSSSGSQYSIPFALAVRTDPVTNA